MMGVCSVMIFFIDSCRSAYASFGGLLMRLQGDANNLHGFEVDAQIYLLIKKLAF
jgi:DNA-directed RNA polymerase I, II, and III subunit RPABC3